ncbi:hypothetical protein [Methylorubrum aminovorans]
MLKQAVAGAKAGPATAPAALLARKNFLLSAHGRLAAASAAALIGGLSLGLLAAPQGQSDDGIAQIRSELAAGRVESARLAQEVDRLARIAMSLREASEAARGEAKALAAGLGERIGRSEQALDKRLANLSETMSRSEREQTERLSGMIAALEKKSQAAATPVSPKPEVKTEAKAEPRMPEPTQTGSLPDKPKTETLEGWALRDVYDGVAILEDRRRRLVEVGRGDAVPGIGRVEAIERRGRQWVVVTRQGIITPQAW